MAKKRAENSGGRRVPAAVGKRDRDFQGAAMVNANWRKLAQDVKLHKTVSQWQAIVRTSQPGSKRTGRRPREEIHSERERERQIGRTVC